jgi:vacuolar-type H+-ATPase subunit E/Vma4
MTYEELVRSVEAASEEKNREILRRAVREAEDIIRLANEKADDITAGFLRDGKCSVEVERNRLSYLTSQEVGASVIRAKGECFNKAFQCAKESLIDFRNTDGYPDFLHRVIEESTKNLVDSFVIHIDNRDISIISDILKMKDITAPVIADIDCLGGLVIVGGGGKITIHNTIESRLEKAMNVYSVEVYSELFGD